MKPEQFTTLPEAKAIEHLEVGDKIAIDRIAIIDGEKQTLRVIYTVSNKPKFLKFSLNWMIKVHTNELNNKIKFEHYWYCLSESMYVNDQNYTNFAVLPESLELYKKELKGPWHRLNKEKPLTLEERMKKKKKLT